MRGRGKWIGAGVAALLVALAPDAQATTFCVPTFGPGCADNGTNIEQANLEVAVSTSSNDGVPDTVIVQEHTYVDTNGLLPSGSDDLTIDGAGVAKTTLTSSANTNSFVVSIGGGARNVSMRDLTIEIPSSMPDMQGVGVFMGNGSTLTDVEIVSRNPRATAISDWSDGGSVDGVVVRGENGGSFQGAIQATGQPGASVTVENTEVSDALFGFVQGDPDTTFFVSRSRVFQAEAKGVVVSGGAMTVENMFITTAPDAEALSAEVSGSVTGTLTARHVTGRALGGSDTAAVEAAAGGGTGDANLIVQSSLFDDFERSFKRTASESSPNGNALLTLSHTSFGGPLPPLPPTVSGDGSTSVTNVENIADPMFLDESTELLDKGSPAFDAGLPSSPTTVDIFGNPRPTEGGDGGTALPDQGAYERDLTKPKVKLKGPGKKAKRGKAKFTFSSSEADSTLTCRLDKKKFKPCDAGTKSYSGLKDGKHRFQVVATDRVGNKGKKTKKFKAG